MATRSISTAAAPSGYWRRQGRALVPFAIWALYAVFFTIHALFRAVGDELFRWRNPESIDRAITQVNLPLWLQRNLYGESSLVLDKIATGSHILWFAFPIVVGIAITIWRRELLVRYLCWLTAAWFACDVLFLLFPATPPWMAEEKVTRILFTRGWLAYVDHDSNPVAAFPSLHATIPALVALFARAYLPGTRWLAWGSWAFAALVGFSVIYLGEHWLVDVVAGYALAAIVASLLRRGAVERALGRLPASSAVELPAAAPLHRPTSEQEAA